MNLSPIIAGTMKWGVWGANFTPSQVQLLATQQVPAWNQIECSLAHTTPLTDGTLDTHQTLRVRTKAWAPLGQLLDTPRVASVLNRLSVEYGVAPEVLLLTLLHKHPAGIIPVVGTTKLERYALLMQSAVTEMGLEHWFELLEASWGHKVPCITLA